MKVLLIGEKTDQCDDIVENEFQLYKEDAEFTTDSLHENIYYVICTTEIMSYTPLPTQYVVHLGKHKRIITACADFLLNLHSDQKNSVQT